MLAVTSKQRELVVLIARYRDKNGFPPTYRELAKTLKITAGAVSERIKYSIKKGILTQQPGTCRTLRVVKSFVETGKIHDYVGR